MYFKEELGQTIISLPDCVTIGRAPASQNALDQLKLLLLLLLGCAVQGPTKEHFITRIKGLSLDAQHDIVECIKQVSSKINLSMFPMLYIVKTYFIVKRTKQF